MHLVHDHEIGNSVDPGVHPYRAGSIAPVISLDRRGLPFIEGTAVVVGPLLDDHAYRVVFEDDYIVKRRVLLPTNGSVEDLVSSLAALLTSSRGIASRS